MNDIKTLCDTLQDLNRDVSILHGAIEFVRVGREYLGEQDCNLVSDILWVVEKNAKSVADSANDAEVLAIQIKRSEATKKPKAGETILELLYEQGILKEGAVTESTLKTVVMFLYEKILQDPSLCAELNMTSTGWFNMLGEWMIHRFGSREASMEALPTLIEYMNVNKKHQGKQERKRHTRYKRRR